MFDTLLNPVFSPLLGLPALAVIVLLSLVISIIVTLIYKYMTDQTLMKDLKTRQKELQKRMKAAKKEPDKLMKMQKEAMELNMKTMKQSFKPMLLTFIPVIIIFGWLNANIAYEPIMPGQEFTTTAVFNEGYSGNVTITVPEGIEVIGESSVEIKEGAADFRLKGDEGDYLLVFNHDGRHFDKELSITTEQRYAPVQKIFKKEPIKTISINNKKLIAINLLGKDEGGFFSGRVGWLGSYIIFSLIFGIGLRKLMKIY
ncbi:DUF106 domain-containing protein [Candidatus Woesearchaeota archaeon]|nr:DUF106 domain-containing protein [Candidatus Woesearchaeota archaeon]